MITRIKTSPDRRLELLVVDKATDELFLNQCVTPAYKHVYSDINFPEIIDKSTFGKDSLFGLFQQFRFLSDVNLVKIVRISNNGSLNFNSNNSQ